MSATTQRRTGPSTDRVRRLVAAPPRPVEASAAVLVGMLAPLGSLVVRLLLLGALGSDFAFVTFYPAIALAAWAGGFTGGSTATVVSAALAAFFVLPPRLNLAVDDLLALLVFVASGLVIAWLGASLHAALALSERGRARAAFLAQASEILGRRLERLPTLEALVGVAVPGFADWCAVDLVDERGGFAAVRIAHRDPTKVALGYRLREEYPVRMEDAAGVAGVVRSGLPEVVLDLGDYGPTIPDPRLRGIMVGLQLRSYIAVPVTTPVGDVLGVLTLFMSESGRRFAQEDVETALDLGRRAGTALDHATLFERVRAQRDELDAVAQILADGVLVAEPSGRLRALNPAARAILGPAVDESLDSILAGLAPVPGRPGVRLVEATGRFVVPHVLGDEGVGSRIAVLRDVSEVLETEAARDAFVGMLSHELRTPITTIFGSAQLLQRPIAPESRDSLVADIADEATRLHRLVEDLLVLSRFERGRLDVSPEPILLHRVVASTVARESVRIPGMRIEMQVEPGIPPVLADATYVEQIVRNLVSNAAKYAGSAPHIDVRIDQDGSSVRLQFEDNGPGIREADLERVFGLYERLGSALAAPGAGIGLFVCRQLAETMGGSMRAVGGRGGGACFEVILPVADAAAQPGPTLLRAAPTTGTPSGNAAPA